MPHAKGEPVKIEDMKGNRTDYTKANENSPESDVTGQKNPVIDGIEYTWHHMEDGEHMLLVPRSIHKKFPHTGGASIVRK